MKWYKSGKCNVTCECKTKAKNLSGWLKRHGIDSTVVDDRVHIDCCNIYQLTNDSIIIQKSVHNGFYPINQTVEIYTFFPIKIIVNDELIWEKSFSLSSV